MEQYNPSGQNYVTSRRKFLSGMGAVLGATALSPLEAMAAPNANLETHVGLAQYIENNIRATKPGLNGEQYRKIFDNYDSAIGAVHKKAGTKRNPNKNLDPKQLSEYAGLEVIALIRQATTLDITERNLIKPGEILNVGDMPSLIKSSFDFGQSDKTYNLFKALENYDKVIDILETRKDMPKNVGSGILYKHGDVPSKAEVYQKMIGVIDTLLKYNISAGKYHKDLQRKKFLAEYFLKRIKEEQTARLNS